mmetsp:Transcript_16993/g.30343  ORF Transcript_16993/g.30343 Transcript_16993/m.30343 type:complete len:82 (-) Transcript_16993:86-331(-)
MAESASVSPCGFIKNSAWERLIGSFAFITKQILHLGLPPTLIISPNWGKGLAPPLEWIGAVELCLCWSIDVQMRAKAEVFK